MSRSSLIIFLSMIPFICTYKQINVLKSHENQTPIIGILAQEMTHFVDAQYINNSSKSYIAASYVKFLEGSGARVVPIWIGKEKRYYEDLMNNINGILFPGGAVDFTNTNGLADAGEYIYEIAKDLNDNGDYFPLWGTCLGFELLAYLSNNRNELRTNCDSNSQSLHLDFDRDFKLSKMFEDTPPSIITLLSKESITVNFHDFCVTRENITNFNLDNEWTILSTNLDLNGLSFVSAFESKRYPFYGVQFHPEKIMYEWVKNRNISHTKDAIVANRYFGDFFVSEARKNYHKFDDVDSEMSALIYNYQSTYTALSGSAFEQCYFFS